tara:strand:+ start:1617 stop:1787 length:171 start_codon:yes stop_codon:yes gene_type:complete
MICFLHSSRKEGVDSGEDAAGTNPSPISDLVGVATMGDMEGAVAVGNTAVGMASSN